MSFYDKTVSVDFTNKAVKDFDFLFIEPFRHFDRLMDQDFFYQRIQQISGQFSWRSII